MDKHYLIPITAALAIGCGMPGPVGDWELTSVKVGHAFPGMEITLLGGGLSIDGRGEADLRVEFEATYTYEYYGYYDDYYDEYYDYEYSYEYLISAEGDVEDVDGDDFELELDGDAVNGYGYGYAADLDLDCEEDGAKVTCNGFIRVDGSSQQIELEFEAR